MFGGFGSISSPKLDFFDDSFYPTVEDAEESINEYKDKLNEKADKDWDKLSDSERQEMDEKFDQGMVYEKETFVIVPIQSVIDIASKPKHRREQ